MKKILSVIVTVAVLCTLVCGVLPCEAAGTKVNVSNVEYDVFYGGTGDNFLCNRTSLGTEVGTEYYLTYTVEEITSKTARQCGLLGTSAPTNTYPYENGGILYYESVASANDNLALLLPGYTYFIKYTVTSTGFRYTAARANASESEYFALGTTYKETTVDKLGYFGLWFASGMVRAHLSHVRFYDKNGNDLGVWSPNCHASVTESSVIPKTANIEDSYVIKASNLSNLAISNLLPTDSNRIYIEYTVKSSTSKAVQNGVVLSNAPTANYPHASGMLRYADDEGDPKTFLLDEGAEYIIVIDRSAATFTALIQKTKGDEVTHYTFPITYGPYDKTAGYCSLWFGEGGNQTASFKLVDFKIYDSNYKNLEVQSNLDALDIKHMGPLEDYSGCEAVYYCDTDQSLYALYADKTLKYTEDGVTTTGTYDIKNEDITITVGGKREVYSYYFLLFKNEQRSYRRLFSYMVNFVTGSDTVIASQKVSVANSYRAVKPQNPTLTDYTFGGWYTSNGKVYNFDTIVTETTTLYAKWIDNKTGSSYITEVTNKKPKPSNGHTSSVQDDTSSDTPTTENVRYKTKQINRIVTNGPGFVVIGIISGILLLLAVAGGVLLLIKGGKRRGK